MLKAVLDQLESLTLEEKRAVEEAARAAVARELGAQGAGAPESCPRCGCPSFVRKGHGRDGSQRWLCRGCGSTFSSKTMSLLGYSKLKPEVWLGYVSDMLSGASLRACAELCGVSLKTSWFMRMRLCEVMEYLNIDFSMGEAVGNADGSRTYPCSLRLANAMTPGELEASNAVITGGNPAKRSEDDMLEVL